MSTSPTIFLSYNHRDKPFADELMVHVAPLKQRFEFALWSDQGITAGGAWNSEIQAELEKADIAVLLVSADYLASEWVAEHELPRLLEKANRGETRIIPVIVRPSSWAHTPLAYFQAFPRDGRPLSELAPAERDRAWYALHEVLEAELHRLSESQDVLLQPAETRRRKGTPLAARGKAPTKKQRTEKSVSAAPRDGEPPAFFISHAKEDGDFAENLKARMKELGLNGWIDIDVLEAGVDWRQEIDVAILGSRALILILSPDAKSSEYVTYEWAFALGSGLRIVPLMLRDTPIHPRLEIFQYLDFTNRRARPWDRLFALLKSSD
jgi:hypothetical protein